MRSGNEKISLVYQGSYPNYSSSEKTSPDGAIRARVPDTVHISPVLPKVFRFFNFNY